MDTAKLKKLIKDKGMSLNELSIKSCIGYATVHDIVSGKVENPRIDTVIKIAEGLGETVEKLISKGDWGNE